ncbi:MAG: glycoside hydrolase family 43 protein [Anaerolineae bacterium]|nr:glycoside hydrolase family 43 protein [Anaerolineae bacterium]
MLQSPSNNTFTNPIIPGFYPDPSVCRVGEDYYLVTSTFEYFPGVPVFRSRDLVHWQQIGHCLTRPSQLPLEKAPSSGGIFAPTIRYHAGKFYMVTTNVSVSKHFYVWTEDPAGEWSEPIWIDRPGIDSSLFFDDDGSVYFTWTMQFGIYQAEIDIETGELLTPDRLVWSGTGGRNPEAPHLYKINGMYYLMIAEGGTEYGHMETIARADTPWGPFASCPRNPILTHRNLPKHPIQGTGHADLIQAHDDRWWMVFLAFRCSKGYPNYHHLGRETFLAPVTWDEEGWPVVNETGTITSEMQADCLPTHPWPAEPARDDFDSARLRLVWNFLRNPYNEDWSLTERPGYLRLKGSAITLDDVDSPAFVGRRQQHLNCRVTVSLDFSPVFEGEEAGLTALMNERHHYEIAVGVGDDSRVVFVRRRIGDLSAVVAQESIPDDIVKLQIEADADRYHFGYSLNGEVFMLLATGETRYLSSEVAGGFTGVYFGMYATGSGQGSTTPADFDWFDYSAADVDK